MPPKSSRKKRSGSPDLPSTPVSKRRNQASVPARPQRQRKPTQKAIEADPPAEPDDESPLTEWEPSDQEPSTPSIHPSPRGSQRTTKPGVQKPVPRPSNVLGKYKSAPLPSASRRGTAHYSHSPDSSPEGSKSTKSRVPPADTLSITESEPETPPSSRKDRTQQRGKAKVTSRSTSSVLKTPVNRSPRKSDRPRSSPNLFDDEALVEDDEPPDDDYERDSFLASDNEDIHFEGNQNTKGEGVDDGSDDPFSDSEVFDPSEVLAGNPAVANGVLDVAIQDPATQAMYSELGMKVIPSKITLMVQMVAKTKERPNVAHINYGRLRDGLSNDVARGQLKSVLSFNKHGEFANLGHIDTSRYQYVKDCFYTKDPATGLPDAPAVFLLPAVSAQSLLNVNFDETSQWADSFARKLYVKTFRQEFKLLEAACGELLGASIYHGPIANDGSLLFQTKKKKWTRTPGSMTRSHFEENVGSARVNESSDSTRFPSYLLYNQEVPIYDGQAEPRSSNAGFTCKASDFARLQSLPKINPREVRDDSLVLVGFTVSKFPVLNQTVYPMAVFNILFVVLLAHT